MPDNQRSILILFAHPSVHHSIVNQQMITKAREIPGVIVNDLYENYPEFYIDVAREQHMAAQADLIIFQHPLYWFSAPPIIKLWQDVVLAKGFAYGPDGSKLQDKDFMLAVSAGGKHQSYLPDKKYGATLDELFAPFKATARLCGMQYRPPIVIHSSSYQETAVIEEHSCAYQAFLMDYLQHGNLVFKEKTDTTLITV